MGKGRTYELETVKQLSNQTGSSTWVFTPDRSGASATAVCDVGVIHVVDTKPVGMTVELKKRSGTAEYRTVIASGSSSGESGKDELQRLLDGTPPWAEAYVGVKFDHRQVVLFNVKQLLEYLNSPDVDVGDDDKYEYFDPHLTDSGSISMRKPTTREWPSATAGGDTATILKTELNELLRNLGGDSQ